VREQIVEQDVSYILCDDTSGAPILASTSRDNPQLEVGLFTVMIKIISP
jgi:hypothetical protein